jgi:hypothetical protein
MAEIYADLLLCTDEISFYTPFFSFTLFLEACDIPAIKQLTLFVIERPAKFDLQHRCSTICRYFLNLYQYFINIFCHLSKH